MASKRRLNDVIISQRRQYVETLLRRHVPAGNSFVGKYLTFNGSYSRIMIVFFLAQLNTKGSK